MRCSYSLQAQTELQLNCILIAVSHMQGFIASTNVQAGGTPYGNSPPLGSKLSIPSLATPKPSNAQPAAFSQKLSVLFRIGGNALGNSRTALKMVSTTIVNLITAFKEGGVAPTPNDLAPKPT